MNCPFCGSSKTKVIDKRLVQGSNRRRRECEKCGKRFTTYEKAEGLIRKVRKRDGKLVPFEQEKIIAAIWRAAQSVGGKDKSRADMISDKVVEKLEQNFVGVTVPTVEQIQDIIEKTLVEYGHYKTSKAFILYRQQRAEQRRTKSFLNKMSKVIDDYMGDFDWRVRENSNSSFSFSGLQSHISGAVMAEYALNKVYPKEIADAHINADFHIHDLGLGTFAGYCAGWSIKDLLLLGFNGVEGRTAAKPAKHLNAAMQQIVNFFGTLQNEWAGAQAFSSFDTYLAPMIRYDGLSYNQVKQSVQEFLFAINQTSRWGNQVPFTNITLDWEIPEDMKDQKVIRGGEEMKETYSDFHTEMEIINKAFIEVMTEGDMDGRIFTFPIPTYNITKDFDWKTENADHLFEMTAKYGTPYFQNFVNSDLKPSDVRSMCCRLQLNLKDLRKKTGGLFGSGEKTGSIGVVTINMPKIGYFSRDESEYFEKLGNLMELAKESLEIKRKNVEKYMNMGLLPWSKRYLGNLRNHFSTIGLLGMNESCENFLGEDITSKDGQKFSIKVLEFMRSKLTEFQEKSGHIFNLEATPAEGTSYRLAKIDKKKYKEIKAAGTKKAPYYTNSTQLPVGHTDDIFEALKHQDPLQTRYTGGTVFHGFVGERISSNKTCKTLVKRIAYNFSLPYYTITPTFSVCPVHGYISGEHYTCPFQTNGHKKG